MKSLNNPFVEYGYKGPEYFCDREKETADLMQSLHNESNIALMSPRRLGKSGLIQHVFHRMKQTEPDAVCIYIDLLNTKNQNEFVSVFASRVVSALESNIQSAFRKVAIFFKSIRPTMSFDEFTGEPTFSFDVDANNEIATIEQVFRFISESGKRCYIAFDEFQQITEYPQTGLEALLRSQIQFIPNAYFIFSGSEQHLISEMFLSAKRPFYLSSQMMHIDVINEEKYRAFANTFFAGQNREFDAENFNYLYTLVDGQTWYVQEILHELYATPDIALDHGGINEVTDVILNKYSTGFSVIYRNLTDNQALLLRSIAKARIVKEPLAHHFISTYRLPAVSSTRQALKALESKQMIYKTNEGYIVYDRFMGMWLRR